MPAKKIMVIDDEQDILRLIKGALRKYGHDVDVFSEPVGALGHFQQHLLKKPFMLSKICEVIDKHLVKVKEK